MMKKISTAAAALIAAGLMVAAANAHPTLKSASPEAGGTVTASPTEIRLSFSEGVIPKFSKVEVQDQGGKGIATGKVATDPKDQKQLIVPLEKPLQAGTYTVKWKVVSVDTHRVDGSYSFTVSG
jgi:methionine-rich copper-binding protein CopC